MTVGFGDVRFEVDAGAVSMVGAVPESSLGTTPRSGGIQVAVRKPMYSGLYGVCDSRSGVGGTESDWPVARMREREGHPH